MTYVIGETCIDMKDASCVEMCPVDDCIVGDDEDRMLFINPSECVDCGACVPACPVDAIYPEEELPDSWSNYIEINRIYFDNKALARLQIDQRKPVPPGS